MHKERLDNAIEVLRAEEKRGSPHNYSCWIAPHDDLKLDEAITLDNIHNCGMAACAGGYIAASPMFIQAGGKVAAVLLGGRTVIRFADKKGIYALALYLGIDDDAAERIFVGAGRFYGFISNKYVIAGRFYGLISNEYVELKHVILMLEYLRDYGNLEGFDCEKALAGWSN